ncbi:sodium/hydrogen exchanger 9-like [Notothenia coriiceps]|uniref:Sodium/hydrogen exchanger 9-like n=1 Tax=Notothenia coriiceps TaxID=8208 RepID=A0A6I9P1F4_9TELE|nr:PREDICTED: sodium/hydrogen exchanger 9-like [Notothenia coriiceps]
MKMEQRQENTTLILLSAASLALLTILTVWKSKRCKYRLLNETGGAMFYGMLVGLTVKFLSFYRGENLDNMEALCDCSGLNITPHSLTVNITSQSPLNVRKVSDGVPALSTPHMETFDPEFLFNLFLPPIIFHGAYTLNQET